MGIGAGPKPQHVRHLLKVTPPLISPPWKPQQVRHLPEAVGGGEDRHHLPPGEEPQVRRKVHAEGDVAAEGYKYYSQGIARA